MKQQIVKLGKVAITVDKNYWTITKDYDRLVMVKRQSTGVVYISRKPVPAGIEITNRDYWLSFNIGGADSTTVVNLVQEFGDDIEVAISQKVITEKIEEIEAAIASIDSNSGGHNILPFDGFVTILNRNAISNQKYTSSSQVVAAEYTIVAERTINAAEKFYLKVGDTYYTNWEITTEIPITPVVGGDPLTTPELGVVSKSEWYYTEYRVNKLFYNRSNKVVYCYNYATSSLTPITNIQVVEDNAPEAESDSNPNHATKGSIIVDLEHDKLLTWDGNKWKEISGGKSAYEIAFEKDSTIGTEEQWLASLKGADGSDGKSAYQIWVEQPDNEGKTLNEFLASLKESGFTSKAVTDRPLTDISTSTIYCIPNPNDTNEWTEEIYDDNISDWIILATHTGGLSNINARLNGLEAVLGREFYYDTVDEVTTGNNLTYQTVSPVIKAGTEITIKAVAITGSWNRLVLCYNGSTNLKIKDNIADDTEYTVTLSEDVSSLGYFVNTDDGVRFTLTVKEKSVFNTINEEIAALDSQASQKIDRNTDNIDLIRGRVEDIDLAILGYSDKTANALTNAGCFVDAMSSTRVQGDIFSYTGASLIQIQVEEGDIIETNATFDGSFGACMYDDTYTILEQGEYLSGSQSVIRGISQTPADHRITIEEGEYYLVISDRDGVGYDNKPLWAKKIGADSIASQLERLDENNEELESLKEYIGSPNGDTIEIIDNQGCQIVTDNNRSAGSIFNYNGAKRTIPIEVEGGDIIETNAHASTNDNAFATGFYLTENNTFDSTTFVSGINTITNGQIVIPENPNFNYVIISDRNSIGVDGQPLWAKKQGTAETLTSRVKELEDTKVDTDFQDYCNRERLFEEYSKNTFVWKPFDKAYFSWTNDDARSDMYLYQELCEEFDYPYCPAVPWEKIIENPTIDGTPLLDRLSTIINNDGEILMHSTMVLDTASPDVSEYAKKQWYTYFKDSKDIAEKALNTRINGFIFAGGTGESNPQTVERQKWLLSYYKYSDRMDGSGISNVSTPQFQLGRWRRTMDATHTTEDDVYALYVAAIDDAVANHKWLRFYCHGTSEISIALLRRIFTYIQTKINNGDAEFVTWNYMYEKFKDSALKENSSSGGSGGGGEANVIETIEVNGTPLNPVNKAVNISVPTTLAELNGDSTHRTVTDAEKTAWTNGNSFSGSYNDLTDKPTIPNVQSWALAQSKPSYTASEVGALPDTTTIPVKASSMTESNNTDFITPALALGAFDRKMQIINAATLVINSELAVANILNSYCLLTVAQNDTVTLVLPDITNSQQLTMNAVGCVINATIGTGGNIALSSAVQSYTVYENGFSDMEAGKMYEINILCIGNNTWAVTAIELKNYNI